MSSPASNVFSLLESPAIKLQFYRPKNPLKPGKLVGVKIAFYKRTQEEVSELANFGTDLSPDQHYFWIPLNEVHTQHRHYFSSDMYEIYQKIKDTIYMNYTLLDNPVVNSFLENLLPIFSRGLEVIWSKHSLLVQEYSRSGDFIAHTEISNPVVLTESFHNLNDFRRLGSRSNITNVPYLF